MNITQEGGHGLNFSSTKEITQNNKLTQSLLVVIPINQVPKVIALQAAILQPLSQKELPNGALTTEDRYGDGALSDRSTCRKAGDDEVAV